MRIIEIEDFDSAELAPYKSLTTRKSGTGGMDDVIIAESPKVIERALAAGVQPVSFLCERKHIKGDAAPLLAGIADPLVLTGERETLAHLTGYTLSRGVLCAMKRPATPEPYVILKNASRICVIYDVCEATNVGVIFRTAAALGYDGVLVSPGSCDPFNRRSIRVSMGAVFQIPWTFCPDIMGTLREAGIRSVCMALTDNSIFLDEFTAYGSERYAVVLGSEGYGLPAAVIDRADHVVKIPMYHNVDSLNVGAAAAIALWQLRDASATPSSSNTTQT